MKNKKDNKVENTASKPAESSKPSNSQPAKQDKEEHKHNQEKVTAVVHHDAVTHQEQVLVRDAWTETIYGSKFRCGGCRQLFNTADELTAHQQFYMDQDDYSHTGSSVVTTTTQVEHPAEYETRTVVDKEAYDETVVTGYKCTICGATKQKRKIRSRSAPFFVCDERCSRKIRAQKNRTCWWLFVLDCFYYSIIDSWKFNDRR